MDRLASFVVVSVAIAVTAVLLPIGTPAAGASPPAETVTFTGLGGSLGFAGSSGPLPAPDDPFQCDNGSNDDVDPTSGAPQDLLVDWQADPQCTGVRDGGPLVAASTDDSEVLAGHQRRQLVTLGGAVDAAGALSFAQDDIELPDLPVDVGGSGVVLDFEPDGDAVGAIDPVSGATAVTLPIALRIDTGFGTCATSFVVVMSSDPATSDGLPVAPFDDATGTVSLAATGFTVSATSGSFVCDLVNATAGLPSSIGNHLALSLTAGPAPSPADPVAVDVGRATVREAEVRGAWVPTYVPVVLAGVVAADVTVDWHLEGSANAPTSSFSLTAGSLTVPAGQTYGQLVFWAKGDGVSGQGPVHVVVDAVTGPAGVTERVAPQVVRSGLTADAGVAVSDVQVTEPAVTGPAGEVALGWAVISLVEPATADVTVAWTTEAAGALIPRDLLPRAGTATIPTGRTWTRVPVWVRGDAEDEVVTENARIVLVSATAPVDDAVGFVTVRDTD